MRQLYVPVRWAAVAVAVAATAGCMSIGDDGNGPAPDRSGGRHGGAAAPDGGPVTQGGDVDAEDG
ncbi:hypothetical protein G3I23_38305, partial [Streptomyces sp. SID10115]|nr:hypothetical protein [Streptomyces sp. SID10115]